MLLGKLADGTSERISSLDRHHYPGVFLLKRRLLLANHEIALGVLIDGYTLGARKDDGIRGPVKIGRAHVFLS